MGEASKVVPIDKLSVVITLALAFIFLHEKFTMKSLIGCIFNWCWNISDGFVIKYERILGILLIAVGIWVR